jgi:hypothetical protein
VPRPPTAPTPVPASRRPPRTQGAPEHPDTSTAAPTPVPSASGRSIGDLVGWAAFSCVLVPIVLVVYGTSLGGAAGASLGLVAITGACRILLRRSERSAARLLAEQNGTHRGAPRRSGARARRGGRRPA